MAKSPRLPAAHAPSPPRATGAAEKAGEGGSANRGKAGPGETLAGVLWAAISQGLHGAMSEFAFQGFIAQLTPSELVREADGGASWALVCPSSFQRDWVRDHYLPLLQEAASRELGCRVTIALSVATAAEASPAGRAHAAAARAAADHAADAHAADAHAAQGRGSDAPGWARASDRNPADVQGARALRPRVGSAASSDRFPGDRIPTEPVALPTAQPRNVVSLQTPTSRGRRLDPRYTFDSYVVGGANKMAFSAAWSVADRPGARYSPLFLFGPSGMGKTHLLHAVGHEVLTRHPHLRVACLSAEQWVNEYIQEAQERRFDAFRRRYRDDVDVLLIDDIQFLAGKSASQDEFFHTFNALYESHKQIIVTSDRYPHEIAGLEDRLKTRLQWGLVADVRPPDAETRRAIVDKKAHDLGCAVPTEVADYLAATVSSSVRELEGALVRLAAYAQVTREPITLAECQAQLRPMLTAGAGGPVSVGRVIEVVAAYYGMKPRDLTGPSRQRQVTRARQLAMWLAREHLQLSLPELGRAFGGRDHTTVLISVRKIDGLKGNDASVDATLVRLAQALF